MIVPIRLNQSGNMVADKLFSLFVLLGLCCAHTSLSAEIEFDREIKPILANHCFQCHGPDEGNREADLRLDTRHGAIQISDDRLQAIVPGDPDTSELIRRVESDDESTIMAAGRSGEATSARANRTLATLDRRRSKVRSALGICPAKEDRPPARRSQPPAKATRVSAIPSIGLCWRKLNEHELSPSKPASTEKIDSALVS